MTAPSETPRTEEQCKAVGYEYYGFVRADFARQLERELAEAKALIQRGVDQLCDTGKLRADLARVTAERNKALARVSELEYWVRSRVAKIIAKRDAALSDAMRWRKHCDVMRNGDVSLLVRVLFDITPEQYAATLDSMQERDDG